jgi:hypothetical protein
MTIHYVPISDKEAGSSGKQLSPYRLKANSYLIESREGMR